MEKFCSLCYSLLGSSTPEVITSLVPCIIFLVFGQIGSFHISLLRGGFKYFTSAQSSLLTPHEEVKLDAVDKFRSDSRRLRLPLKSIFLGP